MSSESMGVVGQVGEAPAGALTTPLVQPKICARNSWVLSRRRLRLAQGDIAELSEVILTCFTVLAANVHGVSTHFFAACFECVIEFVFRSKSCPVDHTYTLSDFC
jgi:hypothetical protein